MKYFLVFCISLVGKLNVAFLLGTYFSSSENTFLFKYFALHTVIKATNGKVPTELNPLGACFIYRVPYFRMQI